MIEYVRRNFAQLVGLESPEPLANMYNRNYFRATWVTTALDAGFWQAMWLRPRWFKDIASMVFSAYYLICAEEADEYVRKVRGKMSIEHMRVSWNKPTTPYLKAMTSLLRPPQHRMKHAKPRRCQIPRRPGGPNKDKKITGWMYFDGPLPELQKYDKLILDVPGGGFVAMDPRCHDDKLMAWSRKTGLPVLSLDYGKAPEHPYPYALHECYDAYWMIVKSRGRCLGMKETIPKIVLTGDSAGGNLATGLTLMIARSHTSYFPGDSNSQDWLPMPEALVLIYPALDVNITSWLTEEQATLINDPEMRKINKTAFKRNTEDYRKLTNTPHPSDDELDSGLRMTSTSAKGASTVTKDAQMTNSPLTAEPKTTISSPRRWANGTIKASTRKESPSRKHLNTRLQLTSMISYFNDRVLSPEMLRGMIMLYIPPDMRPDFTTDIYLSPLRAPEDMLAKFPKVYMLCGDKDPLTDDTLIFAGRLKQAHKQVFQGRKELGLIKDKEAFNFKDHVEQWMIPGVSHGFLQFVSVYHDGWKYIDKCAEWIQTAFAESEKREASTPAPSEPSSPVDYFANAHQHHRPRKHRDQSRTAESSDNEDRPLEIGKLTTISETGGSSGNGRRRSISSGRGSIRKRDRDSGRRSPVALRKHPSLVRLSSSEDLIGRRMLGLTSGLAGEVGPLETP